MANSLKKGLLGYDPMEVQMQQQKLWSNMYGQAGSPYEKMGIALGQLGGALFGAFDGGTAQATSLDKVLAQAGQQFTPNSPEYFKYIADSLPDTMMESKTRALTMAAEAEAAARKTQREEVKFVTDNPEQLNQAIQAPAASIQALINRAVQANGGQPLNEQQVAALQSSSAYQSLIGLNAAQQAGFEKAEGAPSTLADKEVMKRFITEAGGDKYQAAIRFQDYKANLTQKGNTPLTAGNVKTGDIATFVTNVETQLKPAQTKLGRYNELKTIISQVASGNNQAVPQLERWLVTAAGDNQIGMNEVKRITNAGGIAERTVGGVQQFLVGRPSAEKLKQITQVVDALEDQAGKQYNTTREKLVNTWATSQLPTETLTAQLGTPYITAAEKKKRAQEAATEATRQQAFEISPAQNSLINKYLTPKR